MITYAVLTILVILVNGQKAVHKSSRTAVIRVRSRYARVRINKLAQEFPSSLWKDKRDIILIFQIN